MEEEKVVESQSTYGKRSLWQWIAIYIVLAIIVYGAVYYLFLKKQNMYSMQPAPSQQAQQVQNNIYKMMPKGKLGTVMTDEKGMTLYTYAKDASGMSNCTSKCLANWPAYTAKSQAGNLPANVTVIKRSDGTLQYAWKGMPLYYFAKDGDSGDAYGNGVAGTWSVVKQ